MSGESTLDRRWWKEAVVYQVYPRSFNDTNGDGIGDLPGVVEKVPYLADLGVDVVWLNPVYKSPNADNGYDISDYRAIMDEFGTRADWEELRSELHARDIRLIMDLVVNHTSDEHQWFLKSRERDPDYEDFYIWAGGHDEDAVEWTAQEGPAGEAPPNAWKSYFGGPAWAYDEVRGEWYLHLFDSRQPDLNWDNPDVRESIHRMMEWWLAEGIDGFRMDVINLLSKPEDLPNDFGDPFNGAMSLVPNGPRIHEFLGEMNECLFDRDLLTVGEMLGPKLPMREARRYLDPADDGLSMLFHFEHVLLDRGDEPWERREWDLTELKAVFDRWQEGLADDGWNALYFNNHDQPRQVSRFGDDGAYRAESAKLLATLLHTLRGTPYLYQGEEIGMTNYPFEALSVYRDVNTLNPIETAIEAGVLDSFESVREIVAANSRDNARTPMQWTAGEHAGFTTGKPWMPVNPNKDEINVEAARADPDSVWHYYRELIALREEYDVMVYGDYEQLTPDDERVWAYSRTLGDDRLFVALNFSGRRTTYEPPSRVGSNGAAELLLANYDDVPASLSTLTLRPWEARIYRLR